MRRESAGSRLCIHNGLRRGVGSRRSFLTPVLPAPPGSSRSPSSPLQDRPSDDGFQGTASPGPGTSCKKSTFSPLPRKLLPTSGAGTWSARPCSVFGGTAAMRTPFTPGSPPLVLPLGRGRRCSCVCYHSFTSRRERVGLYSTGGNLYGGNSSRPRWRCRRSVLPGRLSPWICLPTGLRRQDGVIE